MSEVPEPYEHHDEYGELCGVPVSGKEGQILKFINGKPTWCDQDVQASSKNKVMGECELKFRSKPVEIEAIRYMGPFSVDEMIEAWGRDFFDSIEYDDLGIIEISTLEGKLDPKIGDWIIRGTIGEFYPCKDEVFQQKYEPIEVNPSKGETHESK